mgnify:CR=1 FL=1|jgi:TRAP-type uncharacterized transport system substrate-binding protein
MHLRPALLAVGAAAAFVAAPALAANPIYTGGERGSYFTSFAPLLEELLNDNFLDYQAVPSAGSGENIDHVLANPTAIGFTQSDVLAFRAASDPSIAENITIIRNDVGVECLYAVATEENAARLENWGGVRGFARRLRIATGPETSGAAMTLRFLQSIDPDLARARSISYMESVDAAIQAVIAGEADVAFFVQFADTSNQRFEDINDAELAFIPVIDRNILRQEVNGERVYVAQEVKVTSAGLLSWSGVTQIVTACTPLAYITGNPERLPVGSNERLDLEDVIAIVAGADVSELQPEEDWFQALVDQAATMTDSALESTLQQIEETSQRVFE